METVAKKKPQPRRSFTPEFEADIVERRQRGDRSIGQMEQRPQPAYVPIRRGGELLVGAQQATQDFAVALGARARQLLRV